MKIIKSEEIRRNITLSLPRSLLAKTKLEAVKQDMSLSEFMRKALEDKLEEGTEYQRAKRRQLEKLAEGLDLGTGGRVSTPREDLHERR